MTGLNLTIKPRSICASEVEIAARTRELYERWSYTGRGGVTPLDDDELHELIKLIQIALGVLRGTTGGSLHFLTGLVMIKSGMENALHARLSVPKK